MNHDTRRSGKDNVPELAGRQESNHPLLELAEADVETRADDAALVQTTIELNDDLAGAVVGQFFELADVSLRLHKLKELDDDLAGRTEEDLTLASLLRIVDVLQSIAQNTGSDHLVQIVKCAT